MYLKVSPDVNLRKYVDMSVFILEHNNVPDLMLMLCLQDRYNILLYDSNLYIVECTIAWILQC